MKKLRLDLNGINVESFPIPSEETAAGTVMGAQQTLGCNTLVQCTNNGSCGATANPYAATCGMDTACNPSH
jgi:hypothetical protein